MDGYMTIYTKNDRVGHVRYEIGDGRGYKEIRGLSVSKMYKGKTIYEKGERDSHGISVYNTDEYLASEKIPLTREELLGAMVYTRDNDEQHEDYNVISQNCNDFTGGALAAAKQKGCVGDYLTDEQKEDLRLSQSSDLIKCRIPQKIEKDIEKEVEKFNKISNTAKERIQQDICNGIVNVGSYSRLGNNVGAYTRNCGRH